MQEFNIFAKENRETLFNLVEASNKAITTICADCRKPAPINEIFVCQSCQDDEDLIRHQSDYFDLAGGNHD